MLRSFTRIDGHHDSGRIEFVPLEDRYVTSAVQEERIYNLERASIFQTLLDNLKPRHRQTINAYINGESLVQFARDKGMKRDRIMKWQRTGIKTLISQGVRYS